MRPALGWLLGTRETSVARFAPWVRLGAAIVFVIFGAGKFAAYASELRSFRGYGLPAPGSFVHAIGVLELTGGVMLAAGALTRLAVLLLAGDMVGAIAVAGIGDGEVVPSLTLAPVLLGALVFLLLIGPGSLAIDTRVTTRLRDDPGNNVRRD
jgi:putative oxidoreductase